MKALSLTQPWASLVQRRAKRLETRSWYTSYRGPLVIHASKGFPRDCKEAAAEEDFQRGLGNIDPRDLPLGVGLCVVTLLACVKTTELHKLQAINFKPSADEIAYGDFAEGRYAWLLDHQYDFVEPIPAKGALGLWDWPYEEYQVAIHNGPSLVCTACGKSGKVKLSQIGCFLCADCMTNILDNFSIGTDCEEDRNGAL